MRYHPLLDRWVILAPDRRGRPTDQKDRYLPRVQECPFCPGRESSTPPALYTVPPPSESGGDGAWRIRVFPNKYPALQPKSADHGNASEKGGAPRELFLSREGVGRHEVIVETPEHREDFPDFEQDHLHDVLTVWAGRIRAAYQEQDLAYALLFRNHRARAGASLSHPHSQLIATPVIPKNIRQKCEASQAYLERNNRCLICDLLKQEGKAGSRVILETEEFIVFAPFASRFPFEIFIAPKTHNPDFTLSSAENMGQLAALLKDMLCRLREILDDPPYNLVVNTAPNAKHLPRELKHQPPERYFHWHIEVLPRLAKAAGFEWGSGFHINAVPPEEAASRLREVN